MKNTMLLNPAPATSTKDNNMSLISYSELAKLVEQGVINADPANINGASIDITIGSDIMVESNTFEGGIVDLKAKETPRMKSVKLGEQGYMLLPGDFILATSEEIFNLPNNIAAEYKLKSSLARSGLQHLMAGWCDPGWHGGKLTLELKNVNQYHTLIIRPGMKIGQMVFWECNPVPEENSYAVKGQYNNQATVTGSKGAR